MTRRSAISSTGGRRAERLQPTVPVLLPTWSRRQVALTYHNDIEQLLVVPYVAIAAECGRHPGQPQHRYLPGPASEFQPQLNLPPRVPPACRAQQRRIPTFRGLPGSPGR